MISSPSHMANVAGSIAPEPMERAACRARRGMARAEPRSSRQSARW